MQHFVFSQKSWLMINNGSVSSRGKARAPLRDAARSCNRAVSNSLSHLWADCWDGLLLGLFVRIDHPTGREVGRRKHSLIAHAAPRFEAGARFDVVILHLHPARLRPLAVFAEFDVTHRGLERMGADVVGELVVVEALGRRDRLPEDVKIGVTPAA